MTVKTAVKTTFKRVKEYTHYWLAIAVPSGVHYASWYDALAEQTRRRSLDTTDPEAAFATMRSLEERGITGDPGTALHLKAIRTVAELLDWHEDYTKTLVSAEDEGLNIRLLKRHLGKRQVASLVEEDFDAFRNIRLAAGRTLGTVSRELTTLRSAIKRAVRNRRLRRDAAPHVPEYADKNYKRSAPPKGRVMTLQELAKLIDAFVEVHMLIYVVWLINTAARPGAILDVTDVQIDIERNRVNMNPPGRIQTKKWRPTLPIPTTLLPWCTDLPPGHVITWRGARVQSIKRGFTKAARRAGLPGHEASYSVRHMLGRYMRKKGVMVDEIALWLGHIQPPDSVETTLIYSPDEPEYLMNAKAAVEAFVRELNDLTRHDLLVPPWRA